MLRYLLLFIAIFLIIRFIGYALTRNQAQRKARRNTSSGSFSTGTRQQSSTGKKIDEDDIEDASFEEIETNKKRDTSS